MLALGPRGAVNVHFSLLPAYRGAAPVQWALARGETVTGVTTMLMNERMDEGDILLQREVRDRPRGSTRPRWSSGWRSVGSALLVGHRERPAGGPASLRRPQDHAAATLAPLLSRADGEIDPGLSAEEIERRVRGFDPWPGVWLSASGKRLRLVEARAVAGAGPDRSPGSLTELTREGLVMACGRGTRLLLVEIQPEGRKRPRRQGRRQRQTTASGGPA